MYSDCIDNSLAAELQQKGMKVEWVDDSVEEHPYPPEYHCETTFAEVLDWLRTEKGILVYPYNYPKTTAYAVSVEYDYSIRNTSDAKRRDDSCKDGYDTFDEALVAGINEAIKLL